jgi:hypothetical protein
MLPYLLPLPPSDHPAFYFLQTWNAQIRPDYCKCSRGSKIYEIKFYIYTVPVIPSPKQFLSWRRSTVLSFRATETILTGTQLQYFFGVLTFLEYFANFKAYACQVCGKLVNPFRSYKRAYIHAYLHTHTHIPTMSILYNV